MQKKELSLPGYEYYEYVFEGGINNLYSFQTWCGVVYEIKFKPSPYIFGEDSVFAPYVYEFSILISYKPEGVIKLASDKLIPNTVVTIFLDFYKNNDNNVCIYICDSSDSKQHVRKRKFDLWFLQFNKGDFIKIDEKFIDRDGTEYPVYEIKESISYPDI